MDGQVCDKHPSARAAARILFPNLCLLYLCGHCVNTRLANYTGDYHVSYEKVQVTA